MKTLKAILFDHDGTLVDSEYSHFEMWASILAEYGITLTELEYIQCYAGIPTPVNAPLMIDKYSLAISSSVLIESKRLATELYLSKQAFPLAEGAREVINFFSQKNIKLAVVTGAGREGVDATLSENYLHDSFQTIVSGDDVVQSKPFPDCYLLAIQQLGIDASECIAIEDSENGVASAVAANIPCLAIATSISKHHDLSKSLKTFNKISEIKEWISKNYLIKSY